MRFEGPGFDRDPGLHDRVVKARAPGGWYGGLVEGIYGEAAEEFGVEVGGFLRHDLAGERDVLELVEGDRLDEEGDVGFAGVDQRDGFAGLAQVLNAAGGADLVFSQAEETVEDDGVELRDPELALFGGEVCEKRGDGFGFWS